MSQSPVVYHLALTGFPLGHSRSPAIHNAALKARGLPGEYSLRPVSPDNLRMGLDALVQDLRQGQLHGFNVTIPHKQAILAYCDELTPAARAMGAANLIYLSGSRVIGDNSDAPGFMGALTPHQNRWNDLPRKALVLGAGGSARAVVYGLVSSGWNVAIAARRQEQARDLAENLADGRYLPSITIVDFPSVKSSPLPPTDLIVNTTPLGMHPNQEGCPWPSDLPFPTNVVVYDLVYNPTETTFLKRAAQAGLPTIGGMQMLISQAAIAFERWTGQPAPIDAMVASVS